MPAGPTLSSRSPLFRRALPHQPGSKAPIFQLSAEPGGTLQAMSLRLAVLSVHTCPLAPLGGWETGGLNVYVREVSRELAARGVQVDIFTRRQEDHTADVVELAPGARIVH